MRVKTFMRLWWLMVFLLISVVYSAEKKNTISIKENDKEDFHEFLRDFARDSVFQIKRVKFPFEHDLLNVATLGMDTIYISIKEWKYKPLPVLNVEYRIQFYDNFDRELKDTNERVLSIEGNGNGLDYSLYFKYISGKWYLVKIVDKST